jgi:uncharacterized surface protein with fasciclin (FAS1) repeats
LDAADLTKVLRNTDSGPYTIYAPTNEAFDELGNDLDVLLSKPSLLRKLLRAHIIQGEGDNSLKAVKGLGVENLNGNPIHVREAKGKYYIGVPNDKIDILNSDGYRVPGGVVYPINRVLGGTPGNRKQFKKTKNPERSPSSEEEDANRNIHTFLKQSDNLTTFVTALNAAGLSDRLDTGNYVVFAPNNEAFEKLPEGVLDDLLEAKNKKKLKALLEDHIAKVNGNKHKRLEDKEIYNTLSQNKIYIEQDIDGAFDVNLADSKNYGTSQAHVVDENFHFVNGFVDVIDSVLISTKSKSPSPKSKPKQPKKEYKKLKQTSPGKKVTTSDSESFLNQILAQ